MKQVILLITLIFFCSFVYGQKEKEFKITDIKKVAELNKYKSNNSATIITDRYNKLNQLILEVESFSEVMLIFYYEYDENGNISQEINASLRRTKKNWVTTSYFKNKRSFDDFIDKIIKILNSKN